MKIYCTARLFLLLSLSFISKGDSVTKFPQNCNETNCDALTGSRTCADDESAVFDPDKLKCVLKVGQNYCQVNSEGSVLNHPLECPSNAGCGPESEPNESIKCTCDTDYFDKSDGLCYRRKKLTEDCAEDKECEYDDIFLKCVNGQCRCDPTNSIFMATKHRKLSDVEVNRMNDNQRQHLVRWSVLGEAGYQVNRYFKSESINQCVGLPGKECNLYHNCAANSTCRWRTCVCDDGLTEKADGRCGANHGGSCGFNPCADGLVCAGDSCVCPQVSHQTYNSSGSWKCLGTLYSFCANDTDCEQNNVCSFNEKSGRKQCICKDGFAVRDWDNDDLTCRRTVQVGGNCTNGLENTCNKGLTCVDGICACGDSMETYDLRTKRCVGHVGARCYLNKNSNDVKYPICTEGSTCEESTERYGQCLCKDGYLFTSTGLCVKV